MNLLFSPGQIASSENITIDFSHRSNKFSNLYFDLIKKLKEKLNIPLEYSIIFTQGSGTSAIETIFGSLRKNLGVTCLSSGAFGNRAEKLIEEYNIEKLEKTKVLYYVQFETSNSVSINYNYLHNQYDLVVVDCVSGLGFYDFPKVDIVVGSSSKILGGLPVMGIIIYKSNLPIMDYFVKSNLYNSFTNYLQYGKQGQTPHTSLIPQFISLFKSLDNLITKDNIIQNCLLFKEFDFYIRGDRICPVLTFYSEDTQNLVNNLSKKRIDVYFNSSYMVNTFQVSMFAYKSKEPYEILKEELRKWLK